MLKNWARWTLLILWMVLLLATVAFWNPFTSLPALLKYSVLQVVAAVTFAAFMILIQYWILVSLIFPLPPRADAKAPKSIWLRIFPWMFKKPRINPKAPATLDQLVGNIDAKVEIKEVIDMIAHPERYQASGADVPRGMLFVGPPGVGKTLFARAIANEIGLPFYVLEGSSISGIFMGLGVLKLKTLFAKLRKHEKAIVFIDEIDSIGGRRGRDAGFGGVMDMNMTLNALLTEMDGFHGSNIIFIGATNNDVTLDPALMRSGRMDRRIYFQLPNPEERQDLFRYYLNKVACDQSRLDFDELAKMTSGFSPADIAGIVNEAALIGQRPGGPQQVTMDTIDQSLTRIAVGLDRTLMSGVEISSTDGRVRLNDVIGIDDVKRDVQEVIDFLKHGAELRAIGAKIPKGVLLIGPPGVGKTMLAKAIANEANVPFYGLSGSYLVGGDRIRSLYSQARKSPAAIVFIDEIDAISGTMSDVGNFRSSSLNQLLIELDGLGRSNVVTIGATNNEVNLDPAFMRSGRFDRKAYVGLPDAAARSAIFEKYLKGVKTKGGLETKKFAERSVNFSGADIAATVNEAAIIAVRAGATEVDEDDMEEAIDRISVSAGHKLNVYGMNLARVPDLNVKFADVKGMEEAKAEAEEVVALIRNFDRISDLGLKIPKGILLVGKPGTGKTMLAKAIANEAGVPFYALSGSDFQSMWAGVGANRVRAVYEQARRAGKPAIVFIDEIDALAGRRGIDMGGGAIQDSNKTLNQLLVEMDGFGKHKVFTIGATNHPGLLDPAFLRPGRMDRRIDIPLPDLEGREAILQHYLKSLKVHSELLPRDIARMTVFQAGADIQNIVNEAALNAIRHGRTEIHQTDLIWAVQRVTFGVARSAHLLVDELRATSYHEAGHALVCYYRNRRDRIHVITVVPTGGALGYVWPIEKEDYNSKNKLEYLTDIEVSLGGYAAEHLFLETTTSGVASDFQTVAWTATKMVRSWGMGSFKFNTCVAYDYDNFGVSDATNEKIESEVQEIVNGCLKNVEDLLRAKRPELDRLAQALIERETLYYPDVVAILEPSRPTSDVEREMRELAERKLVGSRSKFDFDRISGLIPPSNDKKKRGSGNGSGSGSQTTSEPDQSNQGSSSN